MSEMEWPSVGEMILLQDRPTGALQGTRGSSRPATWKCKVLEVPTRDGNEHLVVDMGGEYGVATFSPRDFHLHYTWKPLSGWVRTKQSGKVQHLTRAEADEVLRKLRDLAKRQEGARVSPDFRSFLDAFEGLDGSLTAGGEHPSDWE